jgi:hypothetical protein
MTKRQSVMLSPVLADFNDSAGSADGHYFWQDLICARWIHDDQPENHMDVGSRIDGFIAHLCSFREVTMLDVRPSETNVPGLQYVQGDAQKQLEDYVGKFTSVSSLHAIEHFGLGRYRDTLQLDGHVSGLKNISECVKRNGIFYVSFPIGKSAIEFNAQRVIDPMWAVEQLGSDFKLLEFVLIPWRGNPIYGMSPQDVDRNIWGQAGLYRFRRNE